MAKIGKSVNIVKTSTMPMFGGINRYAKPSMFGGIY